ncbi:MAG: ankyrin repeat domain-containing protein, partial [Gammaproteobacteria bacterium]|nr:ankyrin repeat domain-containing protein [Gammaproteobacteria bacterium]
MKKIKSSLILFILLLTLNACTGDTFSELQLASARGQTDRVIVMIDKGMNVNDVNKHGKTALMLAAGAGHADTVAVLVERNAHLDAQDIDGMTALTEAAAGGHAKVVELLIEKGANANLTNKYGATPLTNAVFFGHEEATRALLASKTRLSEETTENAFLIAAGLGNVQLLTDLLAYGVDLNSRGKQGRTALMAATTFEHVDAVKFLTEKGADLTIRDIEGQTVLDIAREQ